MDNKTKSAVSLYAMIVLYVGSGANHFVHPDFYLSILPHPYPCPDFLNASGGVAEIILGFLLLPENTRKISAGAILAMLTVFLVVIHIPMCFIFYGKNDFMFWVSVIRIPLQFVLIAWAFGFVKEKTGTVKV